MRVVVLFDNLGPYHIARLTQLGKLCDLLAVEQNTSSSDYAWQTTAVVPFRRITLFNSTTTPNRKSGKDIYQVVENALSDFNPEVVVVPGWATNQAMSAILWARIHCVPVVVMSDSQEIDFPRKKFSEWIKRLILSSVDGAFVAGSSHRDYVMKLGMNKDRIRLGYDVVDNDYFYHGALMVKENVEPLRVDHNLPKRFFLTSARFVEKKNISSLISAFSAFLQINDVNSVIHERWSLIILGDGPMRTVLEQQISELGLVDRILLLGFKQYQDLPIYYGLAEAFILPSTTEQWGLVVNEAMASGLPVLVSNRCGSAVDLVKNGVNGYCFDPYNLTELSSFMTQIAKNEVMRKKMGQASLEIIKNWTTSMFSNNLIELAEGVRGSPLSKKNWFANILLRAMLYRPFFAKS